MNLIGAQKLVHRLAEHFDIEPPEVKWKRRKANSTNNKSWYYGPKHIIRLDITADENTLLHEFSHALTMLRGHEINHNKHFVIALLEVVEYYYKGDYAKYPLKWEYVRVQKLFKSIGGKYNARNHKENSGPDS